MPIASFLSVLPQRLLVSLVLLASLQVQAFTLGPVQGAVLIGRPLDVAVPVQLDPNETVTSDCFEADVFHGDTRQDPSGVSVRLEPTSLPMTALVRVTSRSRVDEPIVTVYLRAGCAQMVSRRYSLLADISSEPAAPLVPRVAAVPLVEPSTASTARVATAGAGSAAPVLATKPRAEINPQPSARSRGRSEKTRRTKPALSKRQAPVRPGPEVVAPRAPAPAGESVRAPTVLPATRGAGQSRLTLDPLEMLSERVATLESNAAAAPAQVSERDAREAERLDRLEASVKSLLALAEKNEASVRDVRSRIEQAQADRWGNTVTTLLFGLLLLSLLAIVYLLFRMRRPQEPDGGRWFDARQAPDPVARPAQSSLSEAAMAPVSSPAPLPTPTSLQPADRLPIEPTEPAVQRSGVRNDRAGNAQVDVSLVEMSESTFDRLMQSGAAHDAVRQTRETVPLMPAETVPLVASAPAVPRARIDANALIDIRQRAEFFVTLGQTDQAVQVLEAQIAQDAASCPQIYLDLLQLFHALGLKADFNQLSEDFTQLFNTHVPDFAHFDQEGRSLEEYPGAVDRLIAAWPRPTVLDTLEQLIYRSQVGVAADAPFDLAALRDLLLLHAVAQLVLGAADEGASSADASAPHGAAEMVGRVDIDLSEPLTSRDASTPVRPQDGATSSLSDNVIVTDATPSGNLIDFDLGEFDVTGKSGSQGD